MPGEGNKSVRGGSPYKGRRKGAGGKGGPGRLIIDMKRPVKMARDGEN